MGRNIEIDARLGGGAAHEILFGDVTIESTALRQEGTKTVFPGPKTYGISNGLATLVNVDASPAGPEPDWAYRITFRDLQSGKGWSELVGVPVGTAPLPYSSDLIPRFTTVIPPETTAGMLQNWADTTETNADRAEVAAAAAEAPTDLMNANLVGNPVSLTTMALQSTFGVYLLATDPRVGFVRGQDIAAAWARAMVLLAPGGGTLFIPEGIWTSATALAPIPSAAKVRGAGLDYSNNPTRGTIIRCSSLSVGTFVTLGNTASGSDSGSTTGALEEITIDGMNLADTPLLVQGRRRRLHNIFARRGLICAADISGQNCEVSGQTIFEQDGYGDMLVVRHEADNKIFAGAQYRGVPGVNGAPLHIILDGTSSGAGGIASGDFHLTGAHMWTGANGVSAPTKGLVWLDLRNGATYFSVGIKNNIFDGTLNAPKIRISVGVGCTLSGLQVTDNMDFQVAGNPDVAHPWLLFEGEGTITDYVIGDNVLRGRSDGRYKSIVHDSGTGVRRRGIVDGNVAQYAQYPVTSVAGSQLGDNTDIGLNRVLAASSGAERKTYAKGALEFTGDGVATSWIFSTALGEQANFVNVTPRNTGLAIRHHTLNIVSGTDNLKLELWDAAGAPLVLPSGYKVQFFWEARTGVKIVA